MPPLGSGTRWTGKKKGSEPKLGAFSPDGYSGGKGGAARLSFRTDNPVNDAWFLRRSQKSKKF
jgi:hypothetical protein